MHLALCSPLSLVGTPERQPRGLRHDETGTVPGLLGRSFRDIGLARLNLGVFVLHFVLMASFLVAGLASRFLTWAVFMEFYGPSPTALRYFIFVFRTSGADAIVRL